MDEERYAATSIALARLFTLVGAGVSIFSFSSSSLGASLSLRPDADIFALACSNAVLDARRCILGVPGVDEGLADEDRARADDNLVLDGVGVPIDERLTFGGGGPIEPVADLVEVGVAALVRILLPNVFDVVGVSRVRTLSLPVSDSADGGRLIPGVTNIDDSRR